jgi:hypothetical protein
MKHVIIGKRHDTDSAEKICDVSPPGLSRTTVDEY